MRTISRLLGVAMLVMGGVAVSVLPASAADIPPMAPECPNIGEKWFSWSSVVQPNDVTHKRTVENYGFTDATATYTIHHETTIGADYTASGTVSVSGSVVIASLDLQTSASLRIYGSTTWGSSFSMSVTIPAQHTVVAYAGTRVVRGNYKYYYCNTSGLLQQTTGTGRSWDNQVTGVVDCVAFPPGGSVAYIAKQEGC